MLQAPSLTCFLIADVSGYSGYLGSVELEHAQDILADLMSSIVSALEPGFALAKLEGDAAFTFQETDEIDGSMLLDTIERCYFGFRRRRRDVQLATSCTCQACSRIPDLDLKFVVHHGEAVHQQIGGGLELVGADVILVHRMLKNSVMDSLGIGPYAFFSRQCLDNSGLHPEELDMTQHNETYDIGELTGWVHDLEKRWGEEDMRERVLVKPEESILTVSAATTVPPQVAWEFITQPAQRMSWQPWVTEVDVQGTVGGRLGVGSSNHCMHGPDAVVEEILDWRPYDYVTDRTTVETPIGPLRLLHTIEFEPSPQGTMIHYRFAPIEGEEPHDLADEIKTGYGEALQSAIPELLSQLEENWEQRSNGPE